MADRETWVALLRAVNLGARNKVPMPQLRETLEEAGYEGVRTYIASGNVLLRRPGATRTRIAADVEKIVARAFDVDTTVVVRSAGELEGLVAHPFGTDQSKTHVTFLAKAPTAAARKRLQALDVEPDRFELRGADVLLHYPNGVQGSRLTSALLERELGVAGTTRTWRTVTRLAELARA